VVKGNAQISGLPAETRARELAQAQP
jgi:hypothetical protein